MPFATATDLTERAVDRKYGGVLRLVPDNDNQAEVIARLLHTPEIEDKDGRGPGVIIYIDEDNRTYSEGLARAVATKIRQKEGSVLAEENIGPSNSILPTLTLWREEVGLPLDAIVYVGTAHHCLLLIDQMSRLVSNVPVVFTDGCSLDNFADKTAELQGPAYLLSAASSYRTIGESAANLAVEILSGCDNCDRARLLEHVTTRKHDLSAVYDFDYCGNIEDMDFIVSKFMKGARVDMTAQASDGSAPARSEQSDDKCSSPIEVAGAVEPITIRQRIAALFEPLQVFVWSASASGYRTSPPRWK